jgi:hypothetical protein
MKTEGERSIILSGPDKSTEAIIKLEAADIEAIDNTEPEPESAPTEQVDSSALFNDGFTMPKASVDTEAPRQETASAPKGMIGLLRTSKNRAIGHFRTLFHKNS